MRMIVAIVNNIIIFLSVFLERLPVGALSHQSAVIESFEVFSGAHSGAHDPSTGGTVLDHSFSTWPLGSTPFRCRHSPASAFLGHTVPFVADVYLFTDTYQSLLHVVLTAPPPSAAHGQQDSLLPRRG